MKWFEKGDAGYILIIGLIILASAVFSGGFRQYNIHLDLNHTQTPEDRSIPGQTADAASAKPLGESFTLTDGTLADASTFDAEQASYLSSYNFTKSTTTIDNKQAIKLSGTAPFADINGTHVTSPSQWSVFYVTHGNGIAKFQYEYVGATKNAAKEAILSAELAKVKIN